MGSGGTGQQQDHDKTSGKDMFHFDLQTREKTASTGHINPFVRSNNRAALKNHRIPASRSWPVPSPGSAADSRFIS
jgi:hypothetical protein